MPTKLTNALLKEITPQEKPYEIRDSELKGLILRVQPSGIVTYICQYARTKRITIGQANLITLTQARDKAKQHLADSVLGAIRWRRSTESARCCFALSLAWVRVIGFGLAQL